MAVALRLSRKGARHRPYYHLVAIDSRKKRSGLRREQIGVYDPLNDTFLEVNTEAAALWLSRGAQASATVKSLLKRAGVGKTPATAPASSDP